MGYHLTGTSHQVGVLQYADDTCLVADSPASCQFQLSVVGNWLQWAGMKAKVPKCQTLALQGSTGKVIDPKLHLDGVSIPFTQEQVKFLGLKVQVSKDATSSRNSIVSRLCSMLEAVDSTPTTRRQKLLLYKAGICPHLIWSLLIEEFPISWLEQKLDCLATRYLKKWAGLAKPANSAILYLPHNMGGMNLPLLSTLHKTLQVSRQSQLLTSRDSCAI